MKLSGTRLALVVVEGAVGVLGVWGGWMMITGGWDLPMDWLEHTPFTTWTLPGWALLLLPGVGVLVAGVATALRSPYDRLLSLAAGAGLVAWIVVQLVWLQKPHPVMQPTIALAGIAILLLARRLPDRRPHRRTPHLTGPRGSALAS